MGHLFSLLAQLSPSIWQQQIQRVVQRISEVLDINEFLVGIWGSPPEDKLPIVVEAVALKEWVCRICDPDNEPELGSTQKNAHGKSASAGRKGSEKHSKSAVKSKADKQASNGRLNGKRDAVIAALPFLLSAISSPHREVRLACLAGVTELASKADIWWSTNERENIIEDVSTEGHVISRDCLVNLFRAISSHSSMIEGDGDVAEVLVRSTFEFAATNYKVIGASPKASNPSTKKPGHAASGTDVDTVISSPLSLPVGDVAVIMTSLVKRIPQMTSPAGLHAVSYILRVVHDSYPPHMLLIAAQQLLISLVYPKGILPRDKHLMSHKLLTPLEYRLATEVVALYNDASLIPLLQDNKLRHEAEDGLRILVAIISSAGKGLEVHHSAGSRDVSLQAQAIKVVTPGLFEVLRQDEKANLLTVSV
jgi:hypothetical protein